MSNINNNKISIKIDQPTQEFDTYLETHESSNRIIFSGIFGIGKTYFLEKYFEQKKKEYFALRLSPVNYSVATTEDIYKLIKYDLIAAILENDAFNPEDIDIPESWYWFFAVQGNLHHLTEGILEKIPIVGSGLTKFIKGTEKLYNSLKTRNGDEVDMREYQSSVPTYYKNEFIDTLITKGIEQISKGLPKILIIDDLDRIDPEHIFRIFNVFSSHFDYKKESENKFCFDKIIFVCDINNIRNIFEVRYGMHTDFNGYIDKFYDREIFYFDNRKGIQDAIEKVILTFKHKSKVQEKAIMQENVLLSLKFLLNTMVYANAVNLRNLLKYNNEAFNVNIDINIPFKKLQQQGYFAHNFPAITILMTLTNLLGNAKNLISALKKAASFRYSSNEGIPIGEAAETPLIISNILFVLDYQKHLFKFNSNIPTKFTSKYNGLVYEYHLHLNARPIYAELVKINNVQPHEIETRYIDLYVELAEMLRDMDIIK